MINQSVTIPQGHLDELRNYLQRQELLNLTIGRISYQMRELNKEKEKVYTEMDTLQEQITDKVKVIETETGISGIIDIESGVITSE